MSAPVLSLLLADSRTPAGGYAHSGGLEEAVACGAVSVGGVRSFIAARLETVGFVEASFAAAACLVSVSFAASAAPGAAAREGLEGGALLGGDRGSGASAAPGAAARDEVSRDEREVAVVERHQLHPHPLLALDDELAARSPSPPLRAAARQLGRALLRLAARLWPADPLLAAYAAASAWTPRPVVLGIVANTAGLTPLDAARLTLYEDAAGVAAAAVKLLPLDAAEATAWVAALAPRIDALAVAASAGAPTRAAAAAPLTASPPPDTCALAAALPAAATPLLDLRSLDHDRSMGRLFVT